MGGRRARAESSEEATTVVQASNGGGSSGRGEERLDSGYVLKVELTGLAERSNKGGGMRERNCYESTLEDLTQSHLGIGVSVVIKSKDCGARWPGCKSNSIAY